MTEATQYLNDLDAQLVRAGIRGARRKRIVTEFADHLSCDPGADLGDPRALAAQFADELGSSFARTAAFRAFAALALTGALVAARLASFVPLRNTSVGMPLDTAALLVCILAAQVALVAGGLGLVRAVLVRRRSTIPQQEATILARRAGIGLAAGAVAMLAVPLHGSTSLGNTTGTPWLAFVAMGVSLGAIALTVPAVIRAARLRPLASGPAGDLLADFGPLQPLATRATGGSVTRLALVAAVALAIVIALAGVAAGDPYDGILRGLLEAGAFLGGYAVLGGYLGIRRRAPRDV